MENVVLFAGSTSGRDTWITALEGHPLSVERASTAASVSDALAEQPVDAAVVDARFDGDGSGLAAVAAVRKRDGDVPLVFRSEASDGELAAAATRAGATEYYPADAVTESLADRVRAHLRAEDGVGEADGRGRSLTEHGSGRSSVTRSPLDAGDSANDGGQARPNGGAEGGATATDSASETDSATETDSGTATDSTAATGSAAAIDSTAATDSAAGAEAAHYEQILEAVDDGVYAVDEDARLMFVNEAITDLTGYDRAELLGEDVEMIADPEAVPEATRIVEEMMRGREPPSTVEIELPRADGETIPCEDHLTLLTDEDGEFAGTAGVIRDVTERKRRDRRLSNLLDTARSLLEARTREDVAAVVARATQEALEQDFSVVRLVDEEAGELVPVAGAGEAVLDRPAYPVGEGGPGTAYERGEILRLRHDDLGEPTGDVGYVEDVLYVPLGDDGVLSIVTTDPDGFEESDVSMAEILASTAAVALERALREKELLRYRTVIENVRDMMYVLDRDGQFSLVTDPLAEWLGYDREELVGADAETVVADAEVEALESFVADLWHGDDASRKLETELVTADGDHRPVEAEISLYPTEDEFAGTVGVVRDLSELVRTRELLEEQRDRFSYLFDNLPDAVVEAEHDAGGRPIVREVNDAFTDVFGYDADEVVGESLDDHIVPDDAREEARRLDREALAGEITTEEVRRRTASGYRDFLLRGIPYDRTDAGTLSFGIYTDITAQKERGRRLEVLNRVLRHNLRNDVNVLVGYAELLAENTTDESQRARARALREKATDLAALSDRARSLDQTMRRGSPRDSTIRLDRLVDDVVDEYAVEHPSLAVDADVDPVAVVGDHRLGLALRELVDNVVEHVGTDAAVSIDTERDGRELQLRVADDGPGIPDSELTVLTGSVEITQLRHGSGLGLWVVKWVCESCGGRLEFEADEGGDNAVVITLTPAGNP